MKTSLPHSKRARVTLSVFKVSGIKSIYYLQTYLSITVLEVRPVLIQMNSNKILERCIQYQIYRCRSLR